MNDAIKIKDLDEGWELNAMPGDQDQIAIFLDNTTIAPPMDIQHGKRGGNLMDAANKLLIHCREKAREDDRAIEVYKSAVEFLERCLHD